MIRVPERLNFLIQVFLTSLLMTVFVSGVGVLVSVGTVNAVWFDLWFGVWGLSWLIAFPSLALILFVVRKLSLDFSDSREAQPVKA